jgi:hypothetical protein
VLPDGNVDVTENITFQFIGGPWRGIYRWIPVHYAGPYFLDWSPLVNVKSVTDESKNKVKFETSGEGRYLKLKIYIPDADNSARTASINYTMSNGLRFFDDHDEFYFSVTGDEWETSIAEASAHITLPNGTSGIRANAFTGAYPSFVYNATAKVTGTGVDVHTTAPLAMHQGLFVDVAFDKGSVRDPTAFSLLIPFRYNWPLVVLIIAFLVMLWWWWTLAKAERQSSALKEEKIEQIEKRTEQEPEKTKYAWDLAREKLELYFDGNLSQVRWIFRVAIAVMVAGFVLILWGVSHALANPDSIKPSYLAAVSGIITEFIGVTFMVIYRSTMAQANQYVGVLERINIVGMAVQILDAIPEADSELKNKTRAEMVSLVLSVSSQGEGRGPGHKRHGMRDVPA